jgi:hydrogenase/urease accessory protein HupE
LLALPSFSALRERLSGAGLVVAADLVPKPALAHSTFPGIEGFYSGLLHPLISFDQLLALLGLGVMCGLANRAWLGRSVLAFAILMVAGVCFGLIGYQFAWTSPALLIIGFFAAASAAIRPSGILPPQILLTALGGSLIGVYSTPGPGPLRDMIITLLGSFVGASFGFIMLGGWISIFRERFNRDWSLIALRIVAAWIATISISMAALAMALR